MKLTNDVVLFSVLEGGEFGGKGFGALKVEGR